MATPTASPSAKPNPKAKPKPKKRPPPPPPAAADAARGTGFSRDFQFAEIQWATAYFASYLGGKLVISTSAPKAPQKIRSKWIYAFEVRADNKALLTKEYYADPNGALSFVDGPRRRTLDLPAAPKPVALPAASLPLSNNSDVVKHAFVVMRDRVGKNVILAMENSLHDVFERKYLGEDRYFIKDAAGVTFVPVVDPITLAENLHRAYTDALNAAINFTVDCDGNPKRNLARHESRKYQLARIIRDTLLTVDGQPADPLELQKYMVNEGRTLRDFIEQHESTVRKLEAARKDRAQQLVLLFRSGLWGTLHDWYLGDPVTAEEIGHLWHDGFWQHLERFGETEPGRQFLRQLINLNESPNTPANRRWLGHLIAPASPSFDEKAEALFKRCFPFARKAMASAALGVSEMAPALGLAINLDRAKKMVVRTLEFLLETTEISLVTVRGPYGVVSQSLKISRTRIRIEIPLVSAKLDLEPWVEGGKVHWPEGTKRAAKTGDVLCRLLMGIEVFNFLLGVGEMMNALTAQDGVQGSKSAAIAEAFAGLIDLTVALEEPILGWAHRRAHHIAEEAHEGANAAQAAAAEAGSHGAGHATKAEVTEAFSAAKSEAKSAFGKITGPAIFKGLGAASAVIDTIVYYVEAKEAFGRGETGVGIGNAMVSVGSGLAATASVLNAAGYVVTAAAGASDAAAASGLVLTAAASSFLLAGVVIVTVGYIVIEVFHTSAWQQFIRHTPWGDSPAEPGFQTWSGGNFSTWTDTPPGLTRQTQVLLAMLCSYTVHAALDAHTITASFGGLPPSAAIDVSFALVYVDGQHKNMRYVIDLETFAVREHSGDGPRQPGRIVPYWQGDRLCGIDVRAPRLVDARIKDSTARVILRYGSKSPNADVTTGTIPIKDSCVYRIVEDCGSPHHDIMNSMEVGKEEEEEGKKEQQDPKGENSSNER